MICANCGNNFDEGVYCPVCGAQVEESAETGSEETTLLTSDAVVKVEEKKDETQAESQNNKDKKKKALTPEEEAQKKKTVKKFIIAGVAFAVALTLFLAAIIVGSVASNHPANKIPELLEDGFYGSALDMYVEDMNSTPNKKLVDNLNARIDDLWKNYQENSDDYEYSYDKVNDELTTIVAMGIADEDVSKNAENILGKVTALNTSRDALSEARESMDNEWYVEAIEWYNEVIPEDPNYETAQSELKEAADYYKADAFETIDDSMEWEEYYAAFETLAQAMSLLPNDTEVKEKLTECENAIIAEADARIADKKYDSAIDLINSALEGYPENAALTAKLQEIESGRPTYLSDLKISIDSSNYEIFTDEFTDNSGKVFDGSILFDPGRSTDKTSNAEFYLEKKYTKFTATFAANPSTNDTENFTIEILVDGKAVKTIKNFKSDSKNEAVSIDVTNAQKLEIKVKSTDWMSNNYISMVDACVYK